MPYGNKYVNCSVLFQVHVQLSCAIAWKACLVNFMVLACSLKRGKNVQLKSFLEWMDPQKSKHAPSYLDAKCCIPTTKCRCEDSRQNYGGDSIFYCGKLILLRLRQKISYKTLEFCLSVVAVRHLRVLTYRWPSRPQSGRSEIRY